MAIRITVLGSGTIIPTDKRNPTSILLEIAGEMVLLDCAPCALASLESVGLRFSDVDRVFITHFHPDHTLGLGRLMAALNQLPPAVVRPIEIYGPEGLEEFIERWHILYPATTPKHGGVKLIELGEEAGLPSLPYSFRCMGVRHGGMRALAYRFEFNGVSVVYTGDTEIFEGLVEFVRGCDLLISECSFPDTHRVDGHMTPEDVSELAAESSVGAVLVVHMYPELDGIDVESIIRRKYRGRIYLGYDSFQITI